MKNDKDSIDVTGREHFKVLVQGQSGSVFLSWDTGKNIVFISDDPRRLRDALMAVDELSKFVSEWIAVKQLPLKSIGINGAQKPNEISPSPVIDTASS